MNVEDWRIKMIGLAVKSFPDNRRGKRMGENGGKKKRRGKNGQDLDSIPRFLLSRPVL